MKPQTRKTLLILLLVLLFLLVLRQYLPMIELPTQGRVDQMQRELKSVQTDLQVARKKYQDRVAAIQALQVLADPYWIPSSPAAKVDQEISAEFNRITRLAQLTTAAGSQKVDISKEKNGSCLQEVTLTVDFKNVPMRDLARFFTQMRTTPNGRKFRWEYGKIQPDNPRTPSAVNMNARFKVLVLNHDALNFLGLGQAGLSETPAPVQKTGRSTKK